ncbi:MAG: hypothetical protein GY756_23965 [bacterium]|nr:hypothetical protein [bacterium]
MYKELLLNIRKLDKKEISTLLNVGDTMLGYTTKPGRHLGVEIEESIIER